MGKEVDYQVNISNRTQKIALGNKDLRNIERIVNTLKKLMTLINLQVLHNSIVCISCDHVLGQKLNERKHTVIKIQIDWEHN